MVCFRLADGSLERQGAVFVRMTPIAPLREITNEMMKNARATIASDSLHVKPVIVSTPGGFHNVERSTLSPMAIILEANCHVAALELY